MDDHKSFGVMFMTAVSESKPIAFWTIAGVALGIFVAGLAWSSRYDVTVVYTVMCAAVAIAFAGTYYFGNAVWSKERDARIMAETRIKNDEPVFVGFIDWMFLSPLDENKCQMLLAVNVANSGAPSILEHWRIRLLPEDSDGYEVQEIRVAQHEKLTFTSDVTTDVNGSDFINYKTHPNGIPRGDGRRGLLLCHIPKDLKLKWRVVVSFQDVTGKIWETKPYQPSTRPSLNGFAALGGWSGLDIRHRPLQG
jgi:hypothetical protein